MPVYSVKYTQRRTVSEEGVLVFVASNLDEAEDTLIKWQEACISAEALTCTGNTVSNAKWTRMQQEPETVLSGSGRLIVVSSCEVPPVIITGETMKAIEDSIDHDATITLSQAVMVVAFGPCGGVPNFDLNTYYNQISKA